MTAIDLGLPADVVVKGQLFHTYDLDYLLQDILEIDLPNGLSIDLGWFPECDPSGSFRVVVFKEFWKNQLREPFETRSISEAVDEIRRLVPEYSQAAVAVSCSSDSEPRVQKFRAQNFTTTLAAA